jgi:hypothetical protein
MPVDIVQHLPCLPCQQTLPSVVRGPFHRLRINLPLQQRGCLDYRAVRRLFRVQVTNGRIQQCYYMVYPVARSDLTGLLTGLGYRQRLSEVTIHYQCLPLQSTRDPTVGDLATFR